MLREGWTRYGADGSTHAVNYPEDDALVFDVEILVKTKYFPTMATAVSSECWYIICILVCSFNFILYLLTIFSRCLCVHILRLDRMCVTNFDGIDLTL